MLNIVSRSSALVVALMGLAFADLQACPEIKPAEKLTLKSHYTGKVLVDGARRVTLTLTLDSKTGGSGTLTFDPNTYFKNGSATQIAIHTIAIRADLVPNEDHAAKGRRLYELRRDEVDFLGGRSGLIAEPVRWYLAIPEKPGTPSWLILADEKGKFHDIIVIE